MLAAIAALFLGSAAGAPTAWAHVHASSDNAVRGAMAIVTFSVPNESNTGAATTALTVTLPNVASAATETSPGWTAKVERDASGGVNSVTWTAAPGGGIGTGQFGLFRIQVQLPDTDTVSFPATQTYADGSVVKWDQPPLAGGAEPEHPAPMLTLSTGSMGPSDHHAAATTARPDNTARLLAGGALILGAVAVCLVLVRRRT